MQAPEKDVEEAQTPDETQMDTKPKIEDDADPSAEQVVIEDDKEDTTVADDEAPAEESHIEVDVVLHRQGEIVELSGQESDPGYCIVTEDRSTNCPSVHGSFKKKKDLRKELDVADPEQKPGHSNGDRKDSQIQGKVKKWSKLLKYSLPSKLIDKENTVKGYGKLVAELEEILPSTPKETKKGKETRDDKKSLKDKVKDSDFATFLTERRAVSESRFRVVDKIGDPAVLSKTQSDQSLSDEPWNTGIATGSIKDLKSKFEEGKPTEPKDHNQEDVGDSSGKKDNEEASQLTPKSLESSKEKSEAENKEHLFSQPDIVSSSSGSSSNTKINESPPDSVDDQGKKLKKNGKDKKEKKDKKRNCETCTSDKEHKEHKREKKRVKKERAEKKKLKEAESTVHTKAVIQEINTQNSRMTRENFFQKLLLREEYEIARTERPSRPRKQCKEKRVIRTSQPPLSVFLKGKQAVSDSIFKQYEQLENYLEENTLPRGVIKSEDFFEKKKMFEMGLAFPRSLSNLEKSPPRQISLERPGSTLSNRSVSSERRSATFPRPGSSMSMKSDSSFMLDQIEYRNYVYEMVHSTPKNERFSNLQKYFTTLEKVVKLESTASKSDINKLTSEDIVDFETWREMRKKEKAQDELEELLTGLRKAQKEREFLFRPKEIASVKWTGDSRLRGRDKSVDHLKNLFTKLAENETASNTLPRNSKLNSQMSWSHTAGPKKSTNASVSKKNPDVDRFTTFPQSRHAPSPYKILSDYRSRSSLSMDQVSSLKNQLNEILSTRSSTTSSRQSSRSPSRNEFSIEIKDRPNALKSLGLFVKPIPDIVKRSQEEAEKHLVAEAKPRSRSKDEEERLKISKTLSKELMKRVNFKDNDSQSSVKIDTKEASVPLKFQGKEKPQRDTSPRVCYSLESEAQNQEHNESSDFILVLSDNESNNKHVSEVIDKWASADSEEDVKKGDSKKKRRGKGLAGISSQSSDSISSGTSIHTVICNSKSSDRRRTENDVIHEKSFEEIRKSFENVKEPLDTKIENADFLEDIIPPNTVKEMRKSFENMPLPDPPSEQELQESMSNICVEEEPPKIPKRTSSFHRAVQGTKKISWEKRLSQEHISSGKNSPQSKSTTSIPDNSKDEGYVTFPNSPRKPSRTMTCLEKTYLPEKSVSNIDLTDSENNGLEDTFGKMHEKVHSLCDSRDDFAYEKYHIVDQQECENINARTKYARAYLLLAKAGDVRNKMEQYEENFGKVPKHLPEANPAYIKKKVTDPSKVVIKNQEIANVNFIKARLEKCANKSEHIFDTCGGILTKQKLKHFCKMMGHSKIISKMAMLQKNGKMEDEGFDKLNKKSGAETEYVTKYQAGKVLEKRSAFERSYQDSLSKGPGHQPAFSWSQRFEKDMPSSSYTSAQKHNQFRKYYGYHPTEAPSIPARGASRLYLDSLSKPQAKRSQSNLNVNEVDNSIMNNMNAARASTSLPPYPDPPAYNSVHKFNIPLKSTPSRHAQSMHHDLHAQPAKPVHAFHQLPDIPKDVILSERQLWARRNLNSVLTNQAKFQGLRKPAHPKVAAYEAKTNFPKEIRTSSSGSVKQWEQQRWGEMREFPTEEEVRRRQQEQMSQFYNTITRQKEMEMRKDQENRKHHDTLLPNQKSPVPLNRYEDQGVTGSQAIFLNAGKKPDDCKMVARALFSFQAQNHRELNFKKGDIIYIKKQIDGNWYEGERNAMVGILPTTYVEILPSESAVSQDISNSLKRRFKLVEGEGRAKFNFTAQTPMELSLIKGELVILMRKIDNNWFEGRIGNRKGIFPISYVEVIREPGEEDTKPSVQANSNNLIKSNTLPNTSYLFDKPRSTGTSSPYSTISRPESAQPANSQQQSDSKPEAIPYRAMYNYRPQNEDEVELCEGDVVFVMEKCDDGWFVGTSQRTGIFGTFPGNYVTQIQV